MRMKNRSHRYDINRPEPRHGHKYGKYSKCLSIMKLTVTKKNLSNISGWIHGKVKQHWGSVEKSVYKEGSPINIF